LSWVGGLSNGGEPVLDYSVIYDQGAGSYITLVTGISTPSYVKSGLTVGKTYKFRV
jgi:hypothetical protein